MKWIPIIRQEMFNNLVFISMLISYFNNLYNLIYFTNKLKSLRKCSISFKDEQVSFLKDLKLNFFFWGVFFFWVGLQDGGFTTGAGCGGGLGGIDVDVGILRGHIGGI